MNNVADILHTFSKVEHDRATWDSHWEEIAQRVLPRQADIVTTAFVGMS